MTEILSQDEIDKLLSAVDVDDFSSSESSSSSQDTGDGGMYGNLDNDFKKATSVKIYDFKRPDKFSKDQIRTLQMIHETYARLTTTSLSAQLRSFVNVHVASVDQLTYEEFSRSIPNPATLAIVNMDPLKGSAIMEIDPTITFAIIDRLFGGEGESIKDNRELTDIELSVMEGIVIRTLGNLREAWSNVIDLRPKLGNIETNIQFSQIVPPNDMVVLITLETRIGDVEGMINFCIPYIAIETVNTKLSAQYMYSSVHRGENIENFELIKGHIYETNLNMVPKLGEVTLNINELLALKKKDVIRLNSKVKNDLQLTIGNKTKYFCRPGLLGNRLCVQITDIIAEENEEKARISHLNI